MAVERYTPLGSSGELSPLDMTPEQRRDTIRYGLEDLLPIVAAAYQARDWEHFGYTSWDDYLSHEFGGPLRVAARDVRQLAVVELRQARMSTRAIGAALGVDDKTVRNDLSTAEYSAVETDRIVGLDGKERPATISPAQPMAVHYSSATDQWNTPTHIIDMVVDVLGHIDLDPCSGGSHVPADMHFTEEVDGLSQHWFGKVYMNPPYGDVIGDWTRKLANEYQAAAVTEAIALVPARVDTQWWHEFGFNHWCAIRGRLRFGEATTSAPFPSAAIYLGPNPDKFADVFGQIGGIWRAQA